MSCEWDKTSEAVVESHNLESVAQEGKSGDLIAALPELLQQQVGYSLIAVHPSKVQSPGGKP